MEIKPKKSLGQNFLRDEDIIKKIIESAELKSEDLVVEIGPGEGVLTEKLAEKAGRVLAIELDDRLIELLRSKLRNKNNVEIIHGDVLKLNLSEIISKTFDNSELKSYKLVANIPYYITSAIIRLFLETEFPPREMFVMVQKEVAKRIVAMPGQMSILAVSVQYYAKAEYLFEVKKQSFEPIPKVDSAVIRITRNENQKTRHREEARKFFRIVKAGFSAKRKTLVNNLSNSLQKDRKEIEKILLEMNFLPTVRAQELSVEDWIVLEQKIGNLFVEKSSYEKDEIHR